MSTDRDDRARGRTEHLAGQIADAVEIDWRTRPTPGPDDAPLDALKLISRIAGVYRSLREEPEPARFRWGPLSVYERVGKGSFGEVYRAWDPRLAIDVALKLRPPDPELGGSRVLLDEARGLARLAHPNVVTVRGVDVHDARVGMWTDFVHGPTLEAHLEATGSLEIDEVIRIAGTVARALHAVHEAGYLHGDVTAKNVLLERGATPVLVDFGAAAPLDAHGRAAPELAGLSGTPLAMAPELFLGNRPSIASDVYALGVLAFRLITGGHPVEGDSVDAVRHEHRRGHSRPVRALRPDVPEPLARTIARALEPRAEDRFPSAAAFAEALDASRRPETNLPSRRTSFVGRDDEVARIAARLETGALVTLVGTGGVGKTRLAIEVAKRVVERFPDGVWLVELAGVPAEDVATQVVQTLGIQNRSLADPIEVISQVLADRRMLAVLDSCEHVLDVTARLVERIRATGEHATILVTSRERTGADGERVEEISPLEVPGAHASTETAAMALFVDRVRDVVSDFQLTEENAADVATICRRLDGLPLALELAAAQLRSMGLPELARRMGGALDLLVSPRRTAGRHRTLRAMLDWSRDGLDDATRRLFATLAIFRDGWSLDDAVAVSGGRPDEVVIAHRTLVERSLVRIADTAGETRYRFLEPIREYAAQILDEPDAVGGRLIARMREKLRRAASAEQRAAAYREWLSHELPNAMVALHLALDRDVAAAADLALALGTEWTLRGMYREALAAYDALWTRRSAIGSPEVCAALWLHASAACGDARRLDDAERFVNGVLEAVREGAPPEAQMRAISQLGNIAQGRGDFDRCEALHAEALEVSTRLGNERSRGVCLGNLGIMRRWRGDLDTAATNFREAERIFRALDLPDYAAYSALNLAEVIWFAGRTKEARELATRAVREIRTCGAPYHLVIGLTLLARIGLVEDRLELAEAYATEARALARRSGLTEQYVLFALAALAEWRGDAALAIELATDALRDGHAKPGDVRSVLSYVAVAEGSLGHHTECAWMAACADALRDPRSGEQDPANALMASRLTERLNRAREVLGGEVFAATRRDGAALDYEAATERLFAAYGGRERDARR